MDPFKRDLVRAATREALEEQCTPLRAEGWQVESVKEIRVQYVRDAGASQHEETEFVALLVKKKPRLRPPKDAFRLSPDADVEGTTWMGDVEVPPAAVVRRFGPPAPGDDYKVSGEYVFTDAAREVFVVHDFKSTSLWDEDFATPEEFWSEIEPQELNISSRVRDVDLFAAWFLRALKQRRT
jgi:hypothetical protein